jgi:redox-sensitive bicupin YhaK (pirin superfamily)
MMRKVVHTSDSRGFFDHGWLQTSHSFSFASYYNPQMMGFGALRVLNDDAIAPGKGFGFHPHDNMEIVTIVLSGALRHRDSMGHEAVIRPGEVQIMSAGTGVVHSEYNASHDEPVTLLQIWVYPKESNISPRYEQKAFTWKEQRNKFHTVVSPEKTSEALWINQDTLFSLGSFDEGMQAEYNVKQTGNGIYLFVITGVVEAEDEKLGQRDALMLSDAKTVTVKARSNAEVLIMEVPLQVML